MTTRRNQLGGALAILATVGLVGGIVLQPLYFTPRALRNDPGEAVALFRVEGTSLLAIERVVVPRARGVTTHRFRLRAIDGTTGRVATTRVLEADEPRCAPAREGRLWCSFGGALHLLAADLQTVQQLQFAGFNVDERGLAYVLGADGRAARIDPMTLGLEAIPAIPRGLRAAATMRLATHAYVGERRYQLVGERGQLRQALGVSQGRSAVQILAAEPTYLRGAFLGDGDRSDDALLVDGSVMIVDQETLDPNAPRLLARAALDGGQRWRVPLPQGGGQAGLLFGEALLVSGPLFTVSLAVADGRELWRLRH